MSIQWWRFVTPFSTKWIYMIEAQVTYFCIYIFGLRIAKIQTNNPDRCK